MQFDAGVPHTVTWTVVFPAVPGALAVIEAPFDAPEIKKEPAFQLYDVAFWQVTEKLAAAVTATLAGPVTRLQDGAVPVFPPLIVTVAEVCC
jgi:hypothetical protein